MSRTNGGDLLARSLALAGLTEVFTLHGGHLDAFLMAAPEHGIRLTDTRHESSAGHAADAYARLSGKPGVCVTTSGPGFTNTVTAITNAYLDCIPVLFVVGGPPLREAETNVLQGGFDQVAAAAPVTKWAHRVTSVERIPELVSLALRTAVSGKPGPVLLEIPIDVLFYPVVDDWVRWPAFSTEIPRPAPATAEVQAALAALAGAQRPAIVTGHGALLSRCTAELAAFADAANVPVFAARAEGVLPASHPLSAGGFAQLMTVPFGGAAPDVVLMLGHRWGLFSGGRSGPLAGTTVIQVDTDAGEIGRSQDVAVPIVADVREALRALTDALPGVELPDWSGWVAQAMSTKHLLRNLSRDESTASGRMHPNAAARELVGAFPTDAIVVFDGAESGAWSGPFCEPELPGGVIGFGLLGCLGVGQGLAIGAARAYPGTPVLLVTGDGAVGFHVAEFETMARHELPIITAVFNNLSWGLSLHGQQVGYPGREPVVTALPDSSYDLVARAFGADGHHIGKVDEIGHAVAAALGSGRPTCLNLEIDRDVVHPGGVANLKSVDEVSDLEIVVPYYESIPLPPR